MGGKAQLHHVQSSHCTAFIECACAACPAHSVPTYGVTWGHCPNGMGGGVPAGLGEMKGDSLLVAMFRVGFLACSPSRAFDIAPSLLFSFQDSSDKSGSATPRAYPEVYGYVCQCVPPA